MILLATPLAIIKTSIGVLPSIQIPVASVIWNCAGMPARFCVAVHDGLNRKRNHRDAGVLACLD
ncbi:hypothetical protein [Paraburkholderia fynbosensis]|uniref:hypothetical protein n=1 Tax=Paraburkholderia fynbosensis TaxID=1200993 RepID=UPI0015825257|nr:hypothetical protein [Paraburkholderia fynbosensis]